MGLVSTSQESKWNKTIHAFLQTKKEHQLDGWARSGSDESKKVLKAVTEWIDSVSPTARHIYPTNWSTENHVYRNIFGTFLAPTFSDEFVSLFRDMDIAEIDALAHSFHFDECLQRQRLNEILADFTHRRLTSRRCQGIQITLSWVGDQAIFEKRTALEIVERDLRIVAVIVIASLGDVRAFRNTVRKVEMLISGM